jgi:hypothetical protein
LVGRRERRRPGGVAAEVLLPRGVVVVVVEKTVATGEVEEGVGLESLLVRESGGRGASCSCSLLGKKQEAEQPIEETRKCWLGRSHLGLNYLIWAKMSAHDAQLYHIARATLVVDHVKEYVWTNFKQQCI